MSDDSKWELVDLGFVASGFRFAQTRRLRVEGGWLYRVSSEKVFFVPDASYWVEALETVIERLRRVGS